MTFLKICVPKNLGTTENINTICLNKKEVHLCLSFIYLY